MSRQRVTRFLLWGGLALFIVGTSACTVGCLGAASSAFLGNPEGESLATGGIQSGFLMVTISLLMIVVGAILKATARDEKEVSE